MKLLFWRRKPKSSATPVAEAPPSPRAAAGSTQPPLQPGGLRAPSVERELYNPTLYFARDYLAAAGAQVRMDSQGTLIAETIDGSMRRYTTAVEWAHEDEGVEFLVNGGTALDAMLDDATSRTRLAALRLPDACDLAALVRDTLAQPAAGCSACVREAPSPLCEQCPQRTGRVVVDGLGPIRGITELARGPSRAVELTYVLSGTYRNGRLDDCLRLAFDPRTGALLPALSEEQILRAGVEPITLERGEREHIAEQAHVLAYPALDALALFLRLRSLPDHSRLLDDLRQTRARLLRDDPDSRRATHEAFTREVTRLTEVFAVNVTARLERVCVVESAVARVAVRSAAGTELRLDVDLGRQMVLPPLCSGCGSPTLVSSIRGSRSFQCPSCRATTVSSPDHSSTRVSARHNGVAGRQHALTVAHLDAMGPLTWRAFLHWLLEREGCAVVPCAGADTETDAAAAARLSLRARKGQQPIAALALRQPSSHMVGETEVREAAALGASSLQGERALIATSEASSSAHAEAGRLGVRLLDRAALSDWLVEQAKTYDTEREQAQRDARERAGEASRARETAVELIHEAESALAAALNQHRVSGGAQVAAAATAVAEVQQTAARLFLAWDTLLSDWSESFDDRPDRDGHLVITANAEALRALGERAGHLGRATVDNSMRFAQTPATGELGYTAWRRAVLEGLTARCEAVRWRLLALDPSGWMDFSACHDTPALERAAAAATAASHAAARAVSALSRLRSRVTVG